MQKDGFIYKEMKHYRRKYLVINIICTLLYLAFAIGSFPYIITEMTGATPLDAERFLEETGTVVIDEVIELGRKESKSPDNACYKSESYWQDNRYYYTVDISDIADAGKAFTTMVNMGTGTAEEIEVYRVYVANIGDRAVAVLANSSWVPSKRVSGYMAELSRPVMAKISETLTEGDSLEIGNYMLDIRGVEMDTANTDFACFWIFMLLLVFLWAKLIVHYMKPHLTPTYRQLVKYGDICTVEDDINSQLKKESVYREKGKTILEDYILYRGTFKHEVKRNHMARH